MNSLPRVQLAHLPTVIEYLPNLTKALGGPAIYIKRDDQTGLAFGGNKTRKLEFLLADALAQGAQTLITAGAVQSNHCRQTAAVAAKAGLKCVLILFGEKPQTTSGNLLLDRLFGAELVWVSRAERDVVMEDTFQRLSAAGRKPYLIPYGGSNPIGAAGYVYAMQELFNQRNQVPLQGELPNWIVVASSSGGTQAGLALGAKLYQFPGAILGISVDEPADTLKNRVANLASVTAQNLGYAVQITPDEILVNADYLGEGYGVMGEPEREAIWLFARAEGLLLDPVYTGRAAAGMIDLIRAGKFNRHDRVLFWHTGGAPALFADRYQNRLLDA